MKIWTHVILQTLAFGLQTASITEGVVPIEYRPLTALLAQSIAYALGILAHTSDLKGNFLNALKK